MTTARTRYAIQRTSDRAWLGVGIWTDRHPFREVAIWYPDTDRERDRRWTWDFAATALTAALALDVGEAYEVTPV